MIKRDAVACGDDEPKSGKNDQRRRAADRQTLADQ